MKVFYPPTENCAPNDKTCEHCGAKPGEECMSAKQEKLIRLLDEYIVLLVDELNELASLATVHCWQSSRVYKGKELREKIEEARKEIEG